MGFRKAEVDIEQVCGPDNNVGARSIGGVFSSHAEMLAARADILNAKDRALMKMYLKNGLTFLQIAKIVGMNPTTIARRIRKLSTRLADNKYITCLRYREQFGRDEISIAKDYYMEGMSQRQIARKRGMSVYSTRKVLERIRSVVDSCRTSNRDR